MRSTGAITAAITPKVMQTSASRCICSYNSLTDSHSFAFARRQENCRGNDFLSRPDKAHTQLLGLRWCTFFQQTFHKLTHFAHLLVDTVDLFAQIPNFSLEIVASRLLQPAGLTLAKLGARLHRVFTYGKWTLKTIRL